MKHILASTLLCLLLPVTAVAGETDTTDPVFPQHAMVAKWHLQSGFGLQYQLLASDEVMVSAGAFTRGPDNRQGPNVAFDNVSGYSTYVSHTLGVGVNYTPPIGLRGLFLRFDVNYDIKDVLLYQLSGSITSENQGTVNISHGTIEDTFGRLILVPGLTYILELTRHVTLQVDVGYAVILNRELETTLEWSQGNDQFRYSSNYTVENVYDAFWYYDLPQISAGIGYRF